MTRMHNPPHPGAVLQEYLGDIPVAEAAVKVGVDPVILTRILEGSSSVSAEIAQHLGAALGTSAELWTGMQQQYDLWQAGNAP